jgi:hypothetical protein
MVRLSSAGARVMTQESPFLAYWRRLSSTLCAAGHEPPVGGEAMRAWLASTDPALGVLAVLAGRTRRLAAVARDNATAIREGG